MRKLFLFMNVTLDGYFEDAHHNISWFNSDDDHFEPFSRGGSAEVDTLLFGRRTFEMMKSYWTTPEAAETAPDIASFMNEKRKIVATHWPFEPGWQNVQVIHGDVPAGVKSLKEQPGDTIAMFGSNTLCISLMQAGLVDEFQIVVSPVAIGKGTSLFSGLQGKVELALTETRRFKSGAILLTYRAAGQPAA